MRAKVRGARAVAGQALVFARRAEDARVVWVDGAPAIDAGTILRFTFRAGKIATIEVVSRG